MSTFSAGKRAPLFVLFLVFLFTSSLALAGDKSGDESGYLGVYLQDLEPSMMKALQMDDKSGVLISDIVDDSPAEQAGLEGGDVILVFNGDDMESAKALTKAVSRAGPGEKVKVIVLRDGKEKTIEVELGEREEDHAVWNIGEFKELHEMKDHEGFEGFEGMKWIGEGDHDLRKIFIGGGDRGFLGIHMDDLNEQLGEYFGVEDGEGVLVTEVVEDSPAAKAGLQAGDVIVKLDGEMVASGGDLHDALTGSEADQVVKVEVRRKGDKKNFEVTLGEAPENEFIRKIEILGDDHNFKVKSPRMKKHMAPHFKHQEKLHDGDHDVYFFNDDDEKHRIVIERRQGDLDELREELQEMKKELKKMQKELHK